MKNDIPNGAHITYEWEFRKCGKANCRKCRSGSEHGPYLYGYAWLDGKLKSFYVGAKLPPEVPGPPKPTCRTLEQDLAYAIAHH